MEEEDIEFIWDGPLVDTIKVYRGLAGSYFPPTKETERELDQWNKHLDHYFHGNRYEEIKYLKKIGKYGRVVSLQRAHEPQSVTTDLAHAVSYAKSVAQRTNQQPIIVSVDIPKQDLQRYITKSGGQHGRDVYDIPAHDFYDYFQGGGKVMKPNLLAKN